MSISAFSTCRLLGRLASIALLLFCLVPLTGCVGIGNEAVFSRRAERSKPNVSTSRKPVSGDVTSGDRLIISSPEFEGKKIAWVRSDGRLQLEDHPLLTVGGLSTRDVERLIEESWGLEYRNCQVVVSPSTGGVIHLFSTDAGKGALPVDFVEHEPVCEFLHRVGYGHCKRGYRVRIVRPSDEIGKPAQIIAVQLDKHYHDRNPNAKPIELKPSDTVYLERDIGKPGQLTQMTETPWYQRPIRWVKSKLPGGEGSSARAEKDQRPDNPKTSAIE